MRVKCFFNIFIRRFHDCYNCNSGPFLSHTCWKNIISIALTVCVSTLDRLGPKGLECRRQVFVVVVVPNTACGESLLIIKLTILAFCSGFCNTTLYTNLKNFRDGSNTCILVLRVFFCLSNWSEKAVMVDVMAVGGEREEKMRNRQEKKLWVKG